ncbi:unnamed protein product [Caenorhabditis bovis]|uniref:Uncharacterized protein n=1 Tax=Caenorhabditis bovis TaxID=2654633 RepID=A0A8S1E8W7_9PELO|nr:unnamed protein product [Caenorhabditis bovis]
MAVLVDDYHFKLEFETYPSIQAGLFGKEKFLLALTLLIDILAIIASLLNVVSIQVTETEYSVSVSFINLGFAIVLLIFLIATVYAMYGLLTMMLSKFLLAFYIWAGIGISCTVCSSVVIFHYMLVVDKQEEFVLTFQPAVCAFIRNINVCKVGFNYVIGFVALAVIVFLFKSYQMILLRNLGYQAFKATSAKVQRRNNGKNNGKEISKSESESDDEDVVVFERVFGKYPGGSSIKDSSVA